ncbi:response regulator transcription factor [Ornithinibacillus californiensis]|uniref:response regulator transcription factor n=1 Tax=Ornithinibacillus californiensis TaxID=161536 RepID=UPI00069E8415|nr:LuxR C-terminal-related transcriptional regulator [Ornithinibacillus californiensis]
MKRIEFQYLLFNKIYRDELMKNALVLLEKNNELDKNQKQQLRHIMSAFILFLMTQLKSTRIEEEALSHWIQMHSNDLSVSTSHVFLKIFQESFQNVITQQNHPYKDELVSLHQELRNKIITSYLKWIENPPKAMEEKKKYMLQLDSFNESLIQCNGIDDLPYLITRVEEIFGFKRCVFISYNPWLKEFSGVIGEELEKVQLLRGKIETEPVFSLKRPLFLKKPDPYVQQVAIEWFNLSSIIFIPIIHEQQLYGWVTLDQRGESFECTKLFLDILEIAGKRLGMYLSRKQLGKGIKYPLELSDKELAILHLLSEGYRNKEMAELLFLSEYTVRDYIQTLMTKLRAKNRTQIISMAFRMGLVD